MSRRCVRCLQMRSTDARFETLQDYARTCGTANKKVRARNMWARRMPMRCAYTASTCQCMRTGWVAQA